MTDSNSQKPQPSELVRQVTPKQAARAIGVSESSVKRWCDQGALPNVRTVGGHRRIPIQDLMAFLRSKQHPLMRPEELGLPATSGQTPRMLDRAEEQFRQALLVGNEALARKTVLDLYLAGHHVSAICDLVIAAAFHNIGDLWDCGEIEVYQERRGCDICLRCIYDLRSSLPDTPTPAVIAVGGSPSGDPYLLPTTMIESVLRETGFQATSLGNDIPLSSMAEAIRDTQPKLFWLSVSHIADEEVFLADYAELIGTLSADVAVAVGGRALREPLRQRMTFAAYCDNFRHLESFAATLRRSLLQVVG